MRFAPAGSCESSADNETAIVDRRLPGYSTKEQLGKMVRVALTHGAEGFGLE